VSSAAAAADAADAVADADAADAALCGGGIGGEAPALDGPTTLAAICSMTAQCVAVNRCLFESTQKDSMIYLFIFFFLKK